MKRGQSGYNGIVLIDKPYGISSHDVVNKCRGIFGEKRIGHAGTLDPSATGLMVVLVGQAARLSQYISAERKTYRASVAFGSATNTYDAAGETTLELPVPQDLYDEEFAKTKLSALVGCSMQVPPAFSAIKKDGKRAYASARKGEMLELEPRPIEIFRVENISITHENNLVWTFDVEVSKGTYIRSLAHDLGISLGCASHLCSLRRLSSGNLDLSDAYTLDELSNLDNPASAFINPLSAFNLQVIEIDDEQAKGFSRGLFPLAPENIQDAEKALCVTNSNLVSVVQSQHGVLRPDCVFEGGIPLVSRK